MNLRVVIKPVFHDKYILASFLGFPKVLVVKGLNYVEYVVCWKRNEKDKKKTRVRDPRELGCRGFIPLIFRLAMQCLMRFPWLVGVFPSFAGLGVGILLGTVFPLMRP